MKKKIIGGLFVLAIAAVAAFNFNMSMSENQLSALSLANVEALAYDEFVASCHASDCGDCWSIEI